MIPTFQTKIDFITLFLKGRGKKLIRNFSFLQQGSIRLLATLLLISVVTIVQANTYYSVVSGTATDPTKINSWWTNTNGTGTQPANFTTSGDVFIVQSGSTMTASGNWTVKGTVQVNGTTGVLNQNGRTFKLGALTVNTGGITNINSLMIVNGATTISGTLNLSGNNKSVTLVGAVTLNSGGNWNQTVASPITFKGGLTNNGTFTAVNGNKAIYTFSTNNQSINGILSIPYVTVTGVTLTNNGSLTVPTILAGTGGITQANNSTLMIGGTSTITTLTATNTGNTVNYYASATQTAKPTSYYNLTLSGTNAKTTTSVTVNGTLSMEGTATATAAPTYGSAATLQYNTATARSSGVEWITPFAATGGIIIKNTGTITTSGAKVLNCGIPLTIVSGAKLTLGNTLSVGGNFTNAGTFSSGNFALTFGGNITNTGTMTLGSSNITFGVSGCTLDQSISGLTTTGTVTMAKTSNTATFTGNIGTGPLIINGSGGTLNLGAGLTHTFTSVTMTAGTLNGGTSMLNVSGNWVGTAGTFVPNGGTVVFNGTSAQTISSSASTFNNLTFSGAGTKTFSAAFMVNATTTMVSGTGIVVLPNGTTSTTFLLYYGSTLQSNGSYGSTSASNPATNKNSTYFGTASTGILNVTATTRLVITGSTTQTTGGCQTITITATIPGTTTTDATYTGSKTITFSGANVSPNNTAPTINGTAFGTGLAFTFTSGVATATMCLYKAETAVIGAIETATGFKSRLAADFLNVNVTAAYQLKFTTQPGGGATNSTWATQPIITVQDNYGNLDLTARNITLAIGTNPGSGTLNGTTTVALNTSNATATFTDLSINVAGTGYTLTASASPTGPTSTTSATFNITNPLPTLSSISPAQLCAGGGDFTLFLTGTNFNTQSIVKINDIARTTSFIDVNDLSATILAADIATWNTVHHCI